jgi:hypothetical protein
MIEHRRGTDTKRAEMLKGRSVLTSEARRAERAEMLSD